MLQMQEHTWQHVVLVATCCRPSTTNQLAAVLAAVLHLVQRVRSNDCACDAATAQALGARTLAVHVLGLPVAEHCADLDVLHVADAADHLVDALGHIRRIASDRDHGRLLAFAG